MRAVIDTNVLVSALLRNPSVPRSVVDAALQSRFQLITSPALRAELLRVLDRPRVAGRFPEPNAQIAAFIDRLWQVAAVVQPHIRVNIVHRDPAGNRVIEAAIAGRCDYIVSGDAGLLELGAAEGIRVISPAEFLAVLKDQPEFEA